MIPTNQTFAEFELGPISWYNSILEAKPGTKPTPAGLAHKLMEEATELALACGMGIKQIQAVVSNTIAKEMDKVAKADIQYTRNMDSFLKPNPIAIGEEAADVAINASIVCGLAGLPLTPQVKRKVGILYTRTYRIEPTGAVYRIRNPEKPA